MNSSKKSALLLGLLGLAAGTTATIAMQTRAAGTTTSSSIQPNFGFRQGTPPAAAGSVTAVSGNTISITDKRTNVSYSVDASSATIQKFTSPTGNTTNTTPPTPTTINASDIAVGDSVMVQGTVSGTNITATKIIDGFMAAGHKSFGGGHAPLGNDGNVTSINGSTITMQEEADEGGTSYTVDASSATVTNNGTTGTLSELKVGDKIFVQGTTTGTNVAATSVSLGHPEFQQKNSTTN